MVSLSGIHPGILTPPPEAGTVVGLTHANCVLSDSDHPVTIDHLLDGALIRPADKKSIGVIHIPLPVVLISDHGNGRNNATGLQSVLKRLVVDISRAQDSLQVHEDSRKTTHSKIAKAEIYVGRTQYWTSDIAADDSFSVQVESNADLGVMDLQHPNCVGVTLTIQFGAECLRVHSVTVRGDT